MLCESAMLWLSLTDTDAEVDAAALSDADTLCESAMLWLSLADSDAEVDAAAL